MNITMKKLIYVMAALLSLSFYSCSSDDDEEKKVDPGTEQPTVDGLSATELKEVLCATDVWKMDYLGTAFYFQFKEDGTVISTPGEPYYLKEDVKSGYMLDYNGAEQVLLTIEGSGALKYLTSGIENTLVITAYSSTEVSGMGWSQGHKMVLTPAPAAEWTALVEIRREEAQKNIVNKVLKGNLSCGVIRNSDNHFVAHYKISGDDLDRITFNYLDNNELKHDSYDISIEPGNSESEHILEFGAVTFGTYEISKLYLNSADAVMSADGGLNVDTDNGAAIAFYTGEYRPMHKIDFNPVCGYATPRLMQEIADAQVDEVDLDDRGSRNIIFCPGGGPFLWVGYKGNHRVDPNEPGHIYFNREPAYYPVGAGHGAEFIDENCTQFLSGFFDSEGFFMFREQVGESSFLYMLSPSKDIWFKWEWRPGV